MEYRLWRNAYEEGCCVLKPPQLADAWELEDGVSRIAGHPPDVVCEMSPEFPKDIQLSDNLYGPDTPIVSGRVREILEKLVTHNRVEYLPVKILNHKGRVASTDYFLLHPLDVCDCIDVQASGVQWNAITKGLISRMSGLVLKSDAIPPDFNLFRLRYMGFNILAREDVVAGLRVANLTGLAFRETAGYTGIG